MKFIAYLSNSYVDFDDPLLGVYTQLGFTFKVHSICADGTPYYNGGVLEVVEEEIEVDIKTLTNFLLMVKEGVDCRLTYEETRDVFFIEIET